MDRGAWQATVHGVAKELDMTEQLNNNNIELVTILLLFNTGFFFFFFVLEACGILVPEQG